jgi:phosphate transport system ATP-binding protein
MTASDNGGSGEVVLSARGLGVRAADRAILQNIDLDVFDRQITAVIGPSGCGKTTLVRTFNRMVDLSPGLVVDGAVHYLGRDIFAPDVSPVLVRRRIGMVFQRPTVFPMSIYENAAFGLRLDREPDDVVEQTVERSLRRAGLWDEVRESLDRPALSLSGGQQQRLCIARALAVNPRVLLLDEPTSSLDPVATARIEDLLFDLRRSYTVVIVTHNMQQAARVSDRTAFLYMGRLVEVNGTRDLFESPRERLTEDYITGRFG